MKRELVVLLNLSSWCLVMAESSFLAVPWGCRRFVNVVFPDLTYLLFMVFHENRQTILMKYHALFVIFEKAAKFEIVVCCKF